MFTFGTSLSHARQQHARCTLLAPGGTGPATGQLPPCEAKVLWMKCGGWNLPHGGCHSSLTSFGIIFNMISEGAVPNQKKIKFSQFPTLRTNIGVLDSLLPSSTKTPPKKKQKRTPAYQSSRKPHPQRNDTQLLGNAAKAGLDHSHSTRLGSQLFTDPGEVLIDEEHVTSKLRSTRTQWLECLVTGST